LLANPLLRFGERDKETQTRDEGHEDFFGRVFLSEVHQQTSFVSLQNICSYHVEDEEGEGEEEHEKDLESKTFKRYDIEMQFNQDNPDEWTLQSDDSTSFRP
jgi:hypothetical protein